MYTSVVPNTVASVLQPWDPPRYLHRPRTRLVRPPMPTPPGGSAPPAAAAPVSAHDFDVLRRAYRVLKADYEPRDAALGSNGANGVEG